MLTPIAMIYMALDGHMAYLKATSVLRGGPAIDQRPEKTEDAASKVRRVLGNLADGTGIK